MKQSQKTKTGKYKSQVLKHCIGWKHWFSKTVKTHIFKNHVRHVYSKLHKNLMNNSKTKNGWCWGEKKVWSSSKISMRKQKKRSVLHCQKYVHSIVRKTSEPKSKKWLICSEIKSHKLFMQ